MAKQSAWKQWSKYVQKNRQARRRKNREPENLAIEQLEPRQMMTGDSLGVYQTDTSQFLLDMSINADNLGHEETLLIGQFGSALESGEQLIAGRWKDFDSTPDPQNTLQGYDRLGLFISDSNDPTLGAWKLDVNGNAYFETTELENSDQFVVYGYASDQPIIGDWNGDGYDEIGVFRNGTFILNRSGNFEYLDESATPGTTDYYNGNLVISLGIGTDVAVAGNWNGSSDSDEIGVYRDGTFFLLDIDLSTWDETVSTYNPSTDLRTISTSFESDSSDAIPIVGSWSKFGASDTLDKLGAYYTDGNGNAVFKIDTDGVLTDSDSTNDSDNLTELLFETDTTIDNTFVPVIGEWKPKVYAPASEFFVATGLDASGYGVVRTFHADDLSRWLYLTPYDINEYSNPTEGITGYIGVDVALGDVNRDGIPDLLTAPGPRDGFNPYNANHEGFDKIRVFDGGNFQQLFDVNGNPYYAPILLWEFDAYAEYKTSSTSTTFEHWDGVNISSTDINQDGYSDLIVSAGHEGYRENTPPIRIYSGAPNGKATPDLLAEFYGFPLDQYTASLTVSTGIIDGDIYPDLIISPAEGGNGKVRVFSGKALLDAYVQGEPLVEPLPMDNPSTNELTDAIIDEFEPYVDLIEAPEAYYRGAISVAVSDIDEDGIFEVITATENTTTADGLRSIIRVYKSQAGSGILQQWGTDFELADHSDIQIASTDLQTMKYGERHRTPELLVTSTAPNPSGTGNESKLRIYEFLLDADNEASLSFNEITDDFSSAPSDFLTPYQTGTGSIDVSSNYYDSPNQGPEIHFPEEYTEANPFSLTEDTPQLLPEIQISDPDALETDFFTVTLEVTKGKLQVPARPGDDQQAAQSVLEITPGTLAELNAQLAAITYLPDPDAVGTDFLRVQVSDQGNNGYGGVGEAELESFPLSILPVNDVPHATVDASLVQSGGRYVLEVEEDAGPQTITNLLTEISSGNLYETDQTLTFEVHLVETADRDLFVVDPLESPLLLTYDQVNKTANLQFELKENVNQEIEFYITIADELVGDVDFISESLQLDFTLNVTPINDTPQATVDPSLVESGGRYVLEIEEDAGPQTITELLTEISPGNQYEADQTLEFEVHLVNPADRDLFVVDPLESPLLLIYDQVNKSANLQFELKENVNQEIEFYITVTDELASDVDFISESLQLDFTLNVTPVNDAPLFTINAPVDPSTGRYLIEVDEDAGEQTIENFVTIDSWGNEYESDQVATAILNVLSGDINLFSTPPEIIFETVDGITTGDLVFTAASDVSGTFQFKIEIEDEGEGGTSPLSDSEYFDIVLNAVADAPNLSPASASLDLAINQEVPLPVTASLVDSSETLEIRISGFPANSVFSIGTLQADDTWLITSLDEGFSDQQLESGELTFTPPEGHAGVITLSISATSKEPSNDDEAIVNSTITLNYFNHQPSFVASDITIDEEAEENTTVTISNWVTFDPGAESEASQTPTYLVNISPNSILNEVDGIVINSEGNLHIKPLAHAFGEVTFEVTVVDSGGSINSGNDTSDSQTFTLNLTPINNAPTFDLLTDSTSGILTLHEDEVTPNEEVYRVENFLQNIDLGPYENDLQNFTIDVEVLLGSTVTFSTPPQIEVIDLGGGETQYDLVFRTQDNEHGVAQIRVSVTDDNYFNDAPLTTFKDFTIQVHSVNDPPELTASNPPSSLEDGGVQELQGWAQAEPGPSNENAQSISYTLTVLSGSELLQSIDLDENGTLTYQSVADAFGEVTFEVIVEDDGGTDNGGINTSTQQFSFEITPVNDAPVLTSNDGPFSLDEGSELSLSGFVLGDVDDVNGSELEYEMTVSVQSGILTLPASPNYDFPLAVIDTPSPSLTFSGTLPELEAALNNLTYQPTDYFSGTDALTVTISDPGEINTTALLGVELADLSITVNPVADAPNLSLASSSLDLAVNQTVPLPVASSLVDTDGSESLEITITGVPIGASFLMGSEVTPGTWRIDSQHLDLDQQLESDELIFTPPTDFAGTIELAFVAKSMDGESNPVEATSDTLVLTLTYHDNQQPILNYNPISPILEDLSSAIDGFTFEDADSVYGTTEYTLTFQVSQGMLTLTTNNGLNFDQGEVNEPSQLIEIRGDLTAIQGALENLEYLGEPDFSGEVTLGITIHDPGISGTNPPTTYTFDSDVTLTVEGVADAPFLTESVAPSFHLVNSPVTLSLESSLNDSDNSETLEIRISGFPENSSFSTGSPQDDGTWLITSQDPELMDHQLDLEELVYFYPPVDFVGEIELEVTATAIESFNNDVAMSSTTSIMLTFSNNQKPSFVASDITIDEEAEENTTITISNWATFDPGSIHETSQAPTYLVSIPSNSILNEIDGILIDSEGNLHIKPLAHAFGTVEFEVYVTDDGGTDAGGVDTSDPQTFTLTLNPVNDAPELIVPSSISVPEDELTALRGLSFSDQANESADYTLTLQVEENKGSLFLAAIADLSFVTGSAGEFAQELVVSGAKAAIEAALAQLQYQSKLNDSTTDTLTILLSDDLNNEGIDVQDISTTVGILINPVNDAPTFDLATDSTGGILTINEDEGVYRFESFLVNLHLGPNESHASFEIDIEVIEFTEGNLAFSEDPTFEEGQPGHYDLVLLTAPDTYGKATILVTVTDDDTIDGTALTTSREFVLQVDPINDAPTLSADPLVVDEDGELDLSSLTLTDVDHDETVYTVTLSVQEGNLLLLSDAGLDVPTDSLNNPLPEITFSGILTSIQGAFGNLRYQPTTDYNGTDTLLVEIDDPGDGVDQPAFEVSVPLSIQITPISEVPLLSATELTSNHTVNQIVALPLEAMVGGDPDRELLGIVIEGAPAGSLFLGSLSPDENGTLTIETSQLELITPNQLDFGELEFTPPEDFIGEIELTIKAKAREVLMGEDEYAEPVYSDPITLTLHFHPNQQPSLNAPATTMISEDGGVDGLVTILNWADFDSGAEYETSQIAEGYTVQITAGADLVSDISIEIDGSLLVQLLPDAYGTVEFEAYVTDDGGTEVGGVNTSEIQSFALVIQPVNDAPTFEHLGDFAVPANAGAIVVPDFIHNVSAGPANELQQLELMTSIVSELPNLTEADFDQLPTIDLFTGDLSFKVKEGVSGAATVRIIVTDDDSIDGLAKSRAYDFNLTVNEFSDSDPNTNAPPVLTSWSLQGEQEGSAYQGEIKLVGFVIDPEGAQTSYVHIDFNENDVVDSNEFTLVDNGYFTFDLTPFLEQQYQEANTPGQEVTLSFDVIPYEWDTANAQELFGESTEIEVPYLSMENQLPTIDHVQYADLEITGTLTDPDENAFLTFVEVDEGHDGTIDRSMTVLSGESFRYTLTGDYQPGDDITVAVRGVEWDSSLGDYVANEWQAFTFTREQPEANTAPVVTDLDLVEHSSISEGIKATSNPIITGNVSDLEGWSANHYLEIDLGKDGTIDDILYTIDEVNGTFTYDPTVLLLHGQIDLQIRAVERIATQAEPLTGEWADLTFDYIEEANEAPTISNLTAESVRYYSSTQRVARFSGTLTDETKIGYEYLIEVDFDNDGTADDSFTHYTHALDDGSFTYDFVYDTSLQSMPGLKFRAIEKYYDFATNTFEESISDWTSAVTFTNELTETHELPSLTNVSLIESSQLAAGEIERRLLINADVGTVPDAEGATFRIEIDLDLDGVADELFSASPDTSFARESSTWPLPESLEYVQLRVVRIQPGVDEPLVGDWATYEVEPITIQDAEDNSGPSISNLSASMSMILDDYAVGEALEETFVLRGFLEDSTVYRPDEPLVYPFFQSKYSLEIEFLSPTNSLGTITVAEGIQPNRFFYVDLGSYLENFSDEVHYSTIRIRALEAIEKTELDEGDVTIPEDDTEVTQVDDTAVGDWVEHTFRLPSTETAQIDWNIETLLIPENVPYAFTPFRLPSIRELVEDNQITIQLLASHGSFNVDTTLGGTGTIITGDGTGDLQIVGSEDEINTVLGTLVYYPETNFTGSLIFDVFSSQLPTETSVDPQVDHDFIEIVMLPGNYPTEILNLPETPYSLDEDIPLILEGATALQMADANGEHTLVTLTLSNEVAGIEIQGDLSGLVQIVGNGSLTVTLVGTVLEINKALTSLRLTPSPNYNGPLALEITAYDGGLESQVTSLTSTIAEIQSVEDNFLFHLPATPLEALEDQSFTLQGEAAIQLEDPDGTDQVVVVSLTSDFAEIDLQGDTSQLFQFLGNESHSLSLEGTISAINAALSQAIFIPQANYYGDIELTLTATSNQPSNSVNVSTTLATLSSVNDPVTISIPSIPNDPMDPLQEDQPLLLEGQTAIQLIDADGLDQPISLTFSLDYAEIDVQGDLSQLDQILGNQSQSVTLVGTISTVNLALSQILLTPLANYHGPVTLDVTAYDGEYGSEIIRETISPYYELASVNDAPELFLPPYLLAPKAGTILFSGYQAILISDPDNTTENYEVDISIDQGYFFYGENTTTVEDPSDPEPSSLHFSGSLEAILADLKTVIYRPNNATSNFTGFANLSVIVEDYGEGDEPILVVSDSVQIGVLDIVMGGGTTPEFDYDTALQEAIDIAETALQDAQALLNSETSTAYKDYDELLYGDPTDPADKGLVGQLEEDINAAKNTADQGKAAAKAQLDALVNSYNGLLAGFMLNDFVWPAAPVLFVLPEAPEDAPSLPSLTGPAFSPEATVNYQTQLESLEATLDQAVSDAWDIYEGETDTSGSVSVKKAKDEYQEEDERIEKYYHGDENDPDKPGEFQIAEDEYNDQLAVENAYLGDLQKAQATYQEEVEQACEELTDAVQEANESYQQAYDDQVEKKNKAWDKVTKIASEIADVQGQLFAIYNNDPDANYGDEVHLEQELERLERELETAYRDYYRAIHDAKIEVEKAQTTKDKSISAAYKAYHEALRNAASKLAEVQWNYDDWGITNQNDAHLAWQKKVADLTKSYQFEKAEAKQQRDQQIATAEKVREIAIADAYKAFENGLADASEQAALQWKSDQGSTFWANYQYELATKRADFDRANAVRQFLFEKAQVESNFKARNAEIDHQFTEDQKVAEAHQVQITSKAEAAHKLTKTTQEARLARLKGNAEALGTRNAAFEDAYKTYRDSSSKAREKYNIAISQAGLDLKLLNLEYFGIHFDPDASAYSVPVPDDDTQVGDDDYIRERKEINKDVAAATRDKSIADADDLYALHQAYATAHTEFRTSTQETYETYAKAIFDADVLHFAESALANATFSVSIAAAEKETSLSLAQDDLSYDSAEAYAQKSLTVSNATASKALTNQKAQLYETFVIDVMSDYETEVQNWATGVQIAWGNFYTDLASTERTQAEDRAESLKLYRQEFAQVEYLVTTETAVVSLNQTLKELELEHAYQFETINAEFDYTEAVAYAPFAAAGIASGISTEGAETFWKAFSGSTATYHSNFDTWKAREDAFDAYYSSVRDATLEFSKTTARITYDEAIHDIDYHTYSGVPNYVPDGEHDHSEFSDRHNEATETKNEAIESARNTLDEALADIDLPRDEGSLSTSPAWSVRDTVRFDTVKAEIEAKKNLDTTLAEADFELSKQIALFGRDFEATYREIDTNSKLYLAELAKEQAVDQANIKRDYRVDLSLHQKNLSLEVVDDIRTEINANPPGDLDLKNYQLAMADALTAFRQDQAEKQRALAESIADYEFSLEEAIADIELTRQQTEISTAANYRESIEELSNTYSDAYESAYLTQLLADIQSEANYSEALAKLQIEQAAFDRESQLWKQSKINQARYDAFIDHNNSGSQRQTDINEALFQYSKAHGDFHLAQITDYADADYRFALDLGLHELNYQTLVTTFDYQYEQEIAPLQKTLRNILANNQYQYATNLTLAITESIRSKLIAKGNYQLSLASPSEQLAISQATAEFNYHNQKALQAIQDATSGSNPNSDFEVLKSTKYQEWLAEMKPFYESYLEDFAEAEVGYQVSVAQADYDFQLATRIAEQKKTFDSAKATKQYTLASGTETDLYASQLRTLSEGYQQILHGADYDSILASAQARKEHTLELGAAKKDYVTSLAQLGRDGSLHDFESDAEDQLLEEYNKRIAEADIDLARKLGASAVTWVRTTSSASKSYLESEANYSLNRDQSLTTLQFDLAKLTANLEREEAHTKTYAKEERTLTLASVLGIKEVSEATASADFLKEQYLQNQTVISSLFQSVESDVSISQIQLFHDTGTSSTDQITLDPTIIGQVDFGAMPSLVRVNFDWNDDSLVDGFTYTDSTGGFRFTPQGLSQGISSNTPVTVKAWVDIGDDASQPEASFTFTLEPNSFNYEILSFGIVPDPNDPLTLQLAGSISSDGSSLANVNVAIDLDYDMQADVTILTDASGHFSYDYDTSALPQQVHLLAAQINHSSMVTPWTYVSLPAASDPGFVQALDTWGDFFQQRADAKATWATQTATNLIANANQIANQRNLHTQSVAAQERMTSLKTASSEHTLAMTSAQAASKSARTGVKAEHDFIHEVAGGEDAYRLLRAQIEANYQVKLAEALKQSIIDEAFDYQDAKDQLDEAYEDALAEAEHRYSQAEMRAFARWQNVDQQANRTAVTEMSQAVQTHVDSEKSSLESFMSYQEQKEDTLTQQVQQIQQDAAQDRAERFSDGMDSLGDSPFANYEAEVAEIDQTYTETVSDAQAATENGLAGAESTKAQGNAQSTLDYSATAAQIEQSQTQSIVTSNQAYLYSLLNQRAQATSTDEFDAPLYFPIHENPSLIGEGQTYQHLDDLSLSWARFVGWFHPDEYFWEDNPDLSSHDYFYYAPDGSLGEFDDAGGVGFAYGWLSWGQSYDEYGDFCSYWTGYGTHYAGGFGLASGPSYFHYYSDSSISEFYVDFYHDQFGESFGFGAHWYEIAGFHSSINDGSFTPENSEYLASLSDEILANQYGTQHTAGLDQAIYGQLDIENASTEIPIFEFVEGAREDVYGQSQRVVGATHRWHDGSEQEPIVSEVEALRAQYLSDFQQVIEQGATNVVAFGKGLVEGFFVDGFYGDLEAAGSAISYAAETVGDVLYTATVGWFQHNYEQIKNQNYLGVSVSPGLYVTEVYVTKGINYVIDSYETYQEKVKPFLEAISKDTNLILGNDDYFQLMMNGEWETLSPKLSRESQLVIEVVGEVVTTVFDYLEQLEEEQYFYFAGRVMGMLFYEAAMNIAVTYATAGAGTAVSAAAKSAKVTQWIHRLSKATGLNVFENATDVATALERLSDKLEMLKKSKQRPLNNDDSNDDESRLPELPILNQTPVSCFPAGTKVHTLDGLKNIEDIQPGEMVLTRHETSSHEETQPLYQPVIKTFETHPDLLYHVTILTDSGEEETIVSTGNHPFYVIEHQKFHEVDQLTPGQTLSLPEGQTAKILRLTSELAQPGETFTTYNFSVSETRTYFVGKAGIWVHNNSETDCIKEVDKLRLRLERGMDSETAITKFREALDDIFRRNPDLSSETVEEWKDVGEDVAADLTFTIRNKFLPSYTKSNVDITDDDLAELRSTFAQRNAQLIVSKAYRSVGNSKAADKFLDEGRRKSEKLGELGATLYMLRQYGKHIEKIYQGSGSHTLDLVFYDKKLDKYFVVEAKGAGGKFTDRGVGGGDRAYQGSLEYLKATIKSMRSQNDGSDAGETKRKIANSLTSALKNGKVEYLAVETPVRRSGGINALKDFVIYNFHL
ncbi:Hypothetical protein PBC10988_3310 [Planctomycetales bacterium 10988]|nr:Hypothetical protein PBC10988_3310 [Planctomycetales bacterium 10988]